MARIIDPLKVFDKSSDNIAMSMHWQRSSAVVAGIDAMKAGGSDFLPKFIDEPQKQYDFRLANAEMTNVYNDVLSPLADKPFEKDITLDDEVMSEFIENVDGARGSITTFSKVLFYNGINNAIEWILIDYPVRDETIMTVAQAKASGRKPYWSHVLAQNILEAEVETHNGDERLVFVRILEPDVKGETYCRIFELDGSKVLWYLFKKNKEGGVHSLEGEGTMTIDEIPLVYFITGLRDGKSFKVKPPLKDAVDLQVELYKKESNLNFATIMSAFPMLVGTGVKPTLGADKKSIQPLLIGPSTVLYAPPNGNGDNGDWKFIEPSATSLKFLDERIARGQQQLRELGKQPLTAQSAQLTTVTTAVAAGKAKSAVKAWCINLKVSLESALRITAKFMAISDYKPSVKVYTDFDDGIGDGTDFSAILQMRRERDISREQVLTEACRRNILSEDFNADDDARKLLEEVPADEQDTTL